MPQLLQTERKILESNPDSVFIKSPSVLICDFSNEENNSSKDFSIVNIILNKNAFLLNYAHLDKCFTCPGFKIIINKN